MNFPHEGLRPGSHFLFLHHSSPFKCLISHIWGSDFYLEFPAVFTFSRWLTPWQMGGILPKCRPALGRPQVSRSQVSHPFPQEKPTAPPLLSLWAQPPRQQRAQGTLPSARGHQRSKAAGSLRSWAPRQDVSLPVLQCQFVQEKAQLSFRLCQQEVPGPCPSVSVAHVLSMLPWAVTSSAVLLSVTSFWPRGTCHASSVLAGLLLAQD